MMIQCWSVQTKSNDDRMLKSNVKSGLFVRPTQSRTPAKSIRINTVSRLWLTTADGWECDAYEGRADFVILHAGHCVEQRFTVWNRARPVPGHPLKHWNSVPNLWSQLGSLDQKHYDINSHLGQKLYDINSQLDQKQDDLTSQLGQKQNDITSQLDQKQDDINSQLIQTQDAINSQVGQTQDNINSQFDQKQDD